MTSSLETIQEKDSSLKTRQYTIIGLCTVIAILSAALVVIIFVLLRFVLSNKKKLKKNISIANDHNELKTKFIQNISAQGLGPTLDSLSASAESLSDIAEAQSIQIQSQINALKKFSDDIQEALVTGKFIIRYLRNGNDKCQPLLRIGNEQRKR